MDPKNTTIVEKLYTAILPVATEHLRSLMHKEATAPKDIRFMLYQASQATLGAIEAAEKPIREAAEQVKKAPEGSSSFVN